jgi:hypothetical protein
MIIYLRMKCRLGGRNVIPTGVWPTLVLRGVSQPTPNAPEVPGRGDRHVYQYRQWPCSSAFRHVWRA